MEILDISEELIFYFLSIIRIYGQNDKYLAYTKKHSLYKHTKRKLAVRRVSIWNWVFIIFSSDGKKIDYIKKEYSAFLKERIPRADNFSLRFPKNLSMNKRAIVLATAIVIDLDSFEKSYY